MHGIKNSKSKTRTLEWSDSDRIERKGQRSRQDQNRRNARVEMLRLRGEVSELTF